MSAFYSIGYAVSQFKPPSFRVSPNAIPMWFAGRRNRDLINAMSTKKPSKPRLSLTKSQLQAGVGAELLTLCQSVTDDGSLSKDEIVALREWLNANRSADLPAIAFLAATVQRIIADGKVTKDEQQELYKAIEMVLPPEARKHAVAQRQVVEAEAMASEFARNQAESRNERAERDRNRAIASANFMVAGVHYEGRPEVIARYVNDDDQVYLARDHQNKYSRNAVEIRLQNGMQIGFVPEDYAIDFSPLLDQGFPHRAYVTKILTGGRVPIPVVQAYVYRVGADLGVLPNAIPPKRFHAASTAGHSSTKAGCLSMLVTIILFTLGLAWIS